jgi:hypothetical protein
MLIFGIEVLRIDGDAGDQAAATHRHEDRVEIAARLAQDFHRDGALPGDHVGIVEGMHEGQVALAHDGHRVFVGAVVFVAVQHDLASEIAHRAHLDAGRGLRHHDHRGNATALRSKRHALRMVARRGADDAAPGDRFREVGNLVVGAAQLEREHRLQVLALEQHGIADAAREPRRSVERRFHRHVVDAGLEDSLDVVVGHTGPTY